MTKVSVYYFNGNKHVYEFVTKLGAIQFAGEQKSLGNVAEVRIG